MKINVNGEIKELAMIDLKSGIDCSMDILGNYDALNYNEELDQYTMGSDDFDWWKTILAKMEENEEMLSELSKEEQDELINQCRGDLESEVNSLNDLLHKLKEEQR